MKNRINSIDWVVCFESLDAEQIVNYFTKFLLGLVDEFVPTTWISSKPATHPWLSKASLDAIGEKRNAEGTDEYPRLQSRCSEMIYADYGKYVGTMKKQR